MGAAMVYGIAAAVALLLVFGYCWICKERDTWFLLLFISVCVVNLGYVSLAISGTLAEAMLANRIAYLGSVFLPLCMLMIILRICRIQPGRAVVSGLALLSIATFLVAASGGYTDWYYREVTLEFVNGTARLNKIYGPLHNWYPVYLALYFAMMLAAIVHFAGRADAVPAKQTALIVLSNMAIWLFEQFVDLQFEFLAISYIVSEVLLLFLHDSRVPDGKTEEWQSGENGSQGMEFASGILALTAREREVLNALAADKKRREIADELFVSENTVKKHVSHIYEKLGVASRKELCELLQAEEAETGSEGTEVTENPGDSLPNGENEVLMRDFAALVDTLTPAERGILQYVIDGCSIDEIAERACISIHTVKKHNSNMNRKLGIRSREELLRYIDLFRRSGCLDRISRRPE